MTKGSHKNVLYLAENAISPIQGGGAVVYATHRGLLPEHLLGFYLYPNITPAPEYARRLHLLPGLRRQAAGGRVSMPPVPGATPGAGGFSRMVRGARNRARSIAGPLIEPFFLSDLDFVAKTARAEGFEPEVLFAAPLSLRVLRLTAKLAAHFDVPVVLLNMDDWMAQEAAPLGPLGRAWDWQIARTMDELRPRVRYAYSNSQRLAARLGAAYGVAHDTMNNASADLLIGRPRWAAPPAREGLILAFAGALNWHLQGQTLVRVAEAVSELPSSAGVELRLFAPWEFAPLANMISVPGRVTYRGFLPPEQLADAYLDADVLVLTTTFLKRQIPFFRHSLATKLSDYLCAGRPVLSVGHPDWAVHDYVESNRCGMALRTADRSEIKSALLALKGLAPSQRRDLGQSNRALWERAHDVAVMSRRLREELGLPPLVERSATRVGTS